jgi:GH15 family glucan-1,4-alpha-glucosidase
MTITRKNGYALLRSYGLLSDGHAGALVAADGAADWFATPRLDAAPVCAALLDPTEGGAIALAPTVDYQVTQHYLQDTMVLETTFRAEGGTVVVTDALTVGSAGRLPWTELARRVEARSGEVPMRWQVRLGHRLGTARPWVRRRNGVPIFEASDLQLAVVTDGVGIAQVADQTVGAQFVARPGERGLLAVIATGREPLHVPQVAEIHARIDLTVDWWRRWSATITYDGPHRNSVRRSALTLKALTVAPYDGIAAGADHFPARKNRWTAQLRLPIRLGARCLLRAGRDDSAGPVRGGACRAVLAAACGGTHRSRRARAVHPRRRTGSG